MKPTTIARRAIANELLRRKNQTPCDKTACPGSTSKHPINFLSISVEELPVSEARSGKKQQLAVEELLPTVQHSSSIDTTSIQVGAPANLSTSKMHRRKSSIWKPVLSRDRMSNSVFAALQRNAEQSARDTASLPTPAYVEELEINTAGCQDTQKDEKLVIRIPQQIPYEQESHAFAAFRFPRIEHTDSPIHEPGNLVLQTNLESPSESASPTSDSTLCEEPAVYSLNQPKGRDGLQTYITYDDTARGQAFAAHPSNANEDAAAPIARRRVRHQSQISTGSAFDVTATPSMPLRSREKMNDGLLLFKADPDKDPTAPPPRANRHRSKISLNIPVNAPMVRSEVPRQLRFNNRTEAPRGEAYVQSAALSNMVTSQERELEYKHRHTFIGTGSLDDFLEVLEISSTHATTKHAVARAFVQLSSNEQRCARQCATRADGWELVSRTTLDVMDVTSVDYIVQGQVKLGSITLRQFLDLIPFDAKDEVSAMQVVEAFSAASHLDAKSGVGAGSKARAFRSWIIAQKEDGC